MGRFLGVGAKGFRICGVNVRFFRAFFGLRLVTIRDFI